MVTKPIWVGPLLQETDYDTRDHDDSSINDDRTIIA